MGEVSAALLSLNPVTFRYKKQLDPTGASQFGLVAEEVAKVSLDLVTMDDQGKPFTVRYDEAIKPMDKASEVILSLRPVTFRYKNELDPKGSPQFGLVAEQVATVDPDLVARDEQGKPFTVRYEEVNAMLLNEFLKEHSTVQEQKASISRLQSAMAQQRDDFKAMAAQQEREIQALAASLHKVSDQLELTKSTPRVVANSPQD